MRSIVDGRCIVKILAAIESREPLCTTVSCPGLTFSKAAREGEGNERGRGTHRAAIFRGSSCGTGRSYTHTHIHISRSAVSWYVSPTALRSRRHVTSFTPRVLLSLSLSPSLFLSFSRIVDARPYSPGKLEIPLFARDKHTAITSLRRI